jgi:hypothetical protein
VNQWTRQQTAEKTQRGFFNEQRVKEKCTQKTCSRNEDSSCETFSANSVRMRSASAAMDAASFAKPKIQCPII